MERNGGWKGELGAYAACMTESPAVSTASAPVATLTIEICGRRGVSHLPKARCGAAQEQSECGAACLFSDLVASGGILDVVVDLQVDDLVVRLLHVLAEECVQVCKMDLVSTLCHACTRRAE
jgi:hypothetical protein